MKTTQALTPLFNQFIKESESGKRLKKNGERITKNSINNYNYVLRNLILFSEELKTDIRVCDVMKLTKRELQSEKNYWKKFYKNFTDFLYTSYSIFLDLLIYWHVLVVVMPNIILL